MSSHRNLIDPLTQLRQEHVQRAEQNSWLLSTNHENIIIRDEIITRLREELAMRDRQLASFEDEMAASSEAHGALREACASLSVQLQWSQGELAASSASNASLSWRLQQSENELAASSEWNASERDAHYLVSVRLRRSEDELAASSEWNASERDAHYLLSARLRRSEDELAASSESNVAWRDAHASLSGRLRLSEDELQSREEQLTDRDETLEAAAREEHERQHATIMASAASSADADDSPDTSQYLKVLWCWSHNGNEYIPVVCVRIVEDQVADLFSQVHHLTLPGPGWRRPPTLPWDSESAVQPDDDIVLKWRERLERGRDPWNTSESALRASFIAVRPPWNRLGVLSIGRNGTWLKRAHELAKIIVAGLPNACSYGIERGTGDTAMQKHYFACLRMVRMDVFPLHADVPVSPWVDGAKAWTVEHQESVWQWQQHWQRQGGHYKEKPVIVSIPVMLIRWSHNTISPYFTNGSNFLLLAQQLWQDAPTPVDLKRQLASLGIPRLQVWLDDEGRFWSRNNRRLAAYKMLQALVSYMVEVECEVTEQSDSDRKWVRSFTSTNRGLAVECESPKHRAQRNAARGSQRPLPERAPLRDKDLFWG